MTPELRFKGFTEPWEQRKLGEVGTTYTGLSGKTKNDFGHGEGKFVTYMNVFSNPISSLSMVEPIEVDDSQNEVNVGDVFFTTSSETPEEVGMTSVLLEKQGKTYLNSFCFGYRPTRKFDNYYLAYMLRSSNVRNKIVFLAQGISRYNISKNKVMDIDVPIPNLNEQQEIGAYFKNLDNLITLHQREVDTLTNIKKGLMQKIFSQEIRFKADDGSEFPEWKKKTLSSIGSFYNGLSGKTKDDFGKGNSKYITYMNVFKNVFSNQDLLENVIISEKEKQNHVEYGDMLFTQSSETFEEVGMTSVYLYEDRPYLNSFCIGFHLSDLNTTYPQYMGYLMRTENVRKQIINEGQGISRINLSANRLMNITLIIPCLEEQQKIADCLSAMDKKIEVAQKELETLKTIKKGFLQQMFV